MLHDPARPLARGTPGRTFWPPSRGLLAGVSAAGQVFFAFMIHKMIQLRKEWLVTVGCARGRLCEAPDSWGRDIFFTPPSAAELTPVLGADFESGRPWHFRFENQNMIFSS